MPHLPSPEQAEAARRWALVLPHCEAMLRLARGRGASEQQAEQAVAAALACAVERPDLDEAQVGAALTATVTRLTAGEDHSGVGWTGRAAASALRRLHRPAWVWVPVAALAAVAVALVMPQARAVPAPSAPSAEGPVRSGVDQLGESLDAAALPGATTAVVPVVSMPVLEPVAQGMADADRVRVLPPAIPPSVRQAPVGLERLEERPQDLQEVAQHCVEQLRGISLDDPLGLPCG